MTQTYAIQATGLSKYFRTGFWGRKVVAVRRVDLEVPMGQVFGLVGPNGAGKSTTLKMLLGLVTPDAGSGTMLGMPIGSVQARRSMGYLPELPSFPLHLTPRELLDFHANLAGVARAGWQGTRDALIRRVGLDRAANLRLKVFSKGMLQRAGVAVALVGDPALLVLDEPMSGLDPLGRHDMRTLMMELRAAGKTIVFSTHVLPDVEALCDGVCIIAQGQVYRQGPLHSILSVRTSEVEVRLAEVAPAVADQLMALGSLRPWGNLHVWVLQGGDALSEHLATAIRLGAKVVQVMPRAGVLEDILVEAAHQTSGEGRVSP